MIVIFTPVVIPDLLNHGYSGLFFSHGVCPSTVLSVSSVSFLLDGKLRLEIKSFFSLFCFPSSAGYEIGPQSRFVT